MPQNALVSSRGFPEFVASGKSEGVNAPLFTQAEGVMASVLQARIINTGHEVIHCQPLAMVLYKQGMFEVILQELRDPGTYPAKYREFLWLQRLAAWLASGKRQTEMEEEFRRHYGSQGSSDSYQAIGCYLFGTMSRRQLLDLMKTPQQRCEFTYYIGLSERLQGNFSEAANWYHICRETILQRNGEFHWASTEMFWWAHMGTRNRHLLLADDIKAYREKTETQVGNEREKG